MWLSSPCDWFYRHRISRLCVTPSLRLEKQPSNRRTCILIHLFNWRCSWPTTECTKGIGLKNIYIWNLQGELLWISLLPSLRPGSCYETAMTRKFYHGRTETMRPCTHEAVNWCKAMMDPKCNVSVYVYIYVRTCIVSKSQKGRR